MIPPRRVWLNIGGTVYEVTVYDLLTPDDTPDALKFAQGPGYITVRQVIYPVVPPQTGDRLNHRSRFAACAYPHVLARSKIIASASERASVAGGGSSRASSAR
jgi:hypothetical protein